MSDILIGSARLDENGKISGGAVGDQKQKVSSGDMVGEISQQKFYAHSKGWYVIRPKIKKHAEGIAKSMVQACDNPNIGYDQSNRGGIIKYGTLSKVKTEADCSSTVRQCIIEATGKDPGNFTTLTEKSTIMATGLFDDLGKYKDGMTLHTGDILVTCTKGHTVVVTKGCEIESAKSYSKALAGTYVVTATSLNVRSGAGTDKPVLTSLKSGAVVSCIGDYTDVKGVKWLLIKNKGYASSKYLKRQ